MSKFIYIATESAVRAAREALACQNACNLSGVLSSFKGHLEAIRQDQPMGTDELNRHPAVVLFVDKLADLAGIQSIGAPRVMASYDACEYLQQRLDCFFDESGIAQVVTDKPADDELIDEDAEPMGYYERCAEMSPWC